MITYIKNHTNNYDKRIIKIFIGLGSTNIMHLDVKYKTIISKILCKENINELNKYLQEKTSYWTKKYMTTKIKLLSMKNTLVKRCLEIIEDNPRVKRQLLTPNIPEPLVEILS